MRLYFLPRRAQLSLFIISLTVICIIMRLRNFSHNEKTWAAPLTYESINKLWLPDVRNKDPILSELTDALHHSWKAYVDYAWGMDEVLVLSKIGTRWMDGGLTMIDSLDTLWMYNMTEEFAQARDWIAIKIDFNYNNDRTSVFESTIRLLGGLLSAYHMSKDPIFIKKADLIGHKLLAAFNSPSGLPFTDINLQTLRASLVGASKIVSLSEVSTLQLEFNELAMLLRDKSIAKPAANVYSVLNSVKKLSGLLSIFVNMDHPEMSSSDTITLGARGDSYYEYLLKVWVQTGKKSDWLRNQYLDAVLGITDKLLRKSVPNGLTFIGELKSLKFSPKMDHLVCFLPGTLAYGHLHGMPLEHLQLAEDLMETCYHLYNDTSTGLSAELVYFNLANPERPDFYIRQSDAFNLLRPETVESLFYLYRITKRQRYQQWGRKIFQAFNTYSRVSPAGFAPIVDVRSSKPTHRDKMDSFWIAETLKYFLLLFDDELAARFDLKKWVFNSEGHPFPLPNATTVSLIQDLYNFGP